MPASTNPPSNLEIHVQGAIASGGSNGRLTDWAFHFARSSPTGNPSKAAINSAFQSAIVSKIAAGLNHRWTQSANAIRFLDDATDPIVAFPQAAVGAITGDSMPMHNAVFLLMKAGFRGKSYRGGKHFGPLSEADTTSGSDDLLNAAALALWQAVGTALNAGFSDGAGNQWMPTILSRLLSQTSKNPTTIFSAFVTIIQVNKRIGRMKRREAKSEY